MPAYRVILNTIAIAAFLVYGYQHYKINSDKGFGDRYFFIICSAVLMISTIADSMGQFTENVSLFLYGLLAIVFFALFKYIGRFNADK